MKLSIFFCSKLLRLTALAAALTLLMTPQSYALLETQQTSKTPAATSNVSSLFEKSFLETALAPVKAETKNFLEFNPRLYFNTRHHVPAVKIFRSNGFYESFELKENGALSRRIETGFFENGKYTRTRLYDYDAMKITVLNPKNLFEKRIYELTGNGEMGKPLEYRGRSASGELVNVRFLYNDAAQTVTCVNIRNMHYAIYPVEAFHRLGKLMEIGTAASISKKGLQARTSIKMTEVERDGSVVPVYVFTETTADSKAVTVRERLVEEDEELGIVGRVLNYSGPQGDFEYRYEEGILYPQPGIVITNHTTGMVLKLKVPQDAGSHDKTRLNNIKKKSDSDSRMTLQTSKYMKTGQHGDFVHGKQGGLVFTFEPQMTSLKIWRGFLRGPPSLEANNFNSASNPSFYSSFHLLPATALGILIGGSL